MLNILKELGNVEYYTIKDWEKILKNMYSFVKCDGKISNYRYTLRYDIENVDIKD
jgi:hypothetical protein